MDSPTVGNGKGHSMIKRSILALALMVLGSIGVDQATKYVAEDTLRVWSHETDLRQYRGRSHALTHVGEWSSVGQESPPFYLAFAFNYVRNQGAAWGVLSDVDDSVRIPFFYIVTLAAILMIFMYIRSTPPHHRLARYALALILSGACGNLVDRVLRGYVVDFISVRWVLPMPGGWDWRYHFPNFNWADSCISVGVGMLLFDMLVLEPRRRRQEQGADSSAHQTKPA